MSKVILDFEMDGVVIKYLTITLLSAAGIGILLVINAIFGSNHFIAATDAVGGGIIMASVFGGIGMALFVRRRDYIKNYRTVA